MDFPRVREEKSMSRLRSSAALTLWLSNTRGKELPGAESVTGYWETVINATLFVSGTSQQAAIWPSHKRSSDQNG